MLAFVLSFWLGLTRAQPEAGMADVYAEMARLVPPTAVVMTRDAPSLHYHTGLLALSVPNEPPEGVLAAARHYGATHLLLDQNHPRPLAGLFASGSGPGFVSVQTIGDVQLYRIENDAAR